MSIIEHANIALFAQQRVNLQAQDVQTFRAQVNRLRDRLAAYIQAHPDYSLVKMLHSGSVAKGTALSTLNDMDVAVYVRSSDTPSDESRLVLWLLDRLREAYSGVLKPGQFSARTHCVRISFAGTDLDVDVAPVIYEGDPDDRGYLIPKDTGQRVLTSIPLHLAFIRARKDKHPHHFRQVVRLLKWWVRQCRIADEEFRLKSFLVELMCAHLCDAGLQFADYPAALEKTLAYVVKSAMNERISFTDYSSPSDLPSPTGAPIEVFDPVNPLNNVAANYTDTDRRRIVEAADIAVSAISEARFATTKERAVECWRTVLGPSFHG